jgi:hypothetical protein
MRVARGEIEERLTTSVARGIDRGETHHEHGEGRDRVTHHERGEGRDRGETHHERGERGDRGETHHERGEGER